MAKKQFGLIWLFEPLEMDPGFFSRPMFGGLSAYLDDKIVLVLAEDDDSYEFKGKRYEYPFWNGALFPTEKEYQPSLQEQFPSLVQHLILPKWLYLPMTAPDFEETSRALVELIAVRDPRMGAVPKKKAGAKKKKKKSKKSAATSAKKSKKSSAKTAVKKRVKNSVTKKNPAAKKRPARKAATKKRGSVRKKSS